MFLGRNSGITRSPDKAAEPPIPLRKIAGRPADLLGRFRALHLGDLNSFGPGIHHPHDIRRSWLRDPHQAGDARTSGRPDALFNEGKVKNSVLHVDDRKIPAGVTQDFGSRRAEADKSPEAGFSFLEFFLQKISLHFFSPFERMGIELQIP